MSLAPDAEVRKSRISWVWLIPVVAALVAGFLAWRTLNERGSTITISFRSGDGLVAGQTKVRYKAVELGQVETVRLSDDVKQVIVTVRMLREADPFLTDSARFWVVRPRLSSGSLAGIETLVSGAYIEMDPGDRRGEKKYSFEGLETPPAVRSGEPGTTYRLSAERLGSLSSGAPVFYRDLSVGEVLDYDIGNGLGPVTLTVFIRAPYDKLVRNGSKFWNASGLSLQVGADGLHLELASLQALLSGGVAYDAPHDPNAKPASPGTEFKLYRNYDEAQSAGYRDRLDFVTYFEASARGLSKGAAVDFFGIQVGTVQNVELDLNPATAQTRVKVSFQIQPERIALSNPNNDKEDPIEVARRLVAHGMRAQLQTASFLTGSMVLTLNLDKNAEPAELTQQNGQWVIPSEGGGLDSILSSVSNIANKLDRVPLDEIGNNLNRTLRSASTAMASVGDLANHANSGLSPAFARLPAITSSLEQAVTRADRVLTSLDRGYGKDSETQRELSRAMVQVGDTARSIRQLADFLDRHPEALLRGRAGAQ
ncbi:MAG: MlaD family protein [Acetobacteraceae bacterium]|nr:MlaD family protein [Acetobacteraceae bacterium]